MDIKSFQRALAQIAEERGIQPEKVIETKENAVYRLEDDQYVYGIIEL